MKKSEIRKDYVLDRYVIISPRRSKRPHQLKETKDIVISSSPFTSEYLKTVKIIDSLGQGKKKIVVLANIFPAVTLNNSKAYGTQEVIVETLDPLVRLSDLPVAHIIQLLKMYGRRVRALMKLKKIQYILCLKNEGVAAGASLQHEHSQIFATEIIPSGIEKEAMRLEEYYKKYNRNYYSDLIKKEMKSSRRIYEDKYIAAFAPYASAFQYEVWIFTKREVDNISMLNKGELESVAKVLKNILSKLKKLGLSYNYFCRQVVSDTHQHFCLKIEPRGSTWAGVELDAGLIINSVPPEEAAKYYRKK